MGRGEQVSNGRGVKGGDWLPVRWVVVYLRPNWFQQRRAEKIERPGDRGGRPTRPTSNKQASKQASNSNSNK